MHEITHQSVEQICHQTLLFTSSSTQSTWVFFRRFLFASESIWWSPNARAVCVMVAANVLSVAMAPAKFYSQYMLIYGSRTWQRSFNSSKTIVCSRVSVQSRMQHVTCIPRLGIKCWAMNIRLWSVSIVGLARQLAADKASWALRDNKSASEFLEVEDWRDTQ